LSEYIAKKSGNTYKYASIKAAEEKEYYALSSAQRRLFIIQQTDKNSIAYNLPQVIELEGEPPGKRLEETFRKLIERHDSLRTSFLVINSEPVHKVHDEVAFEIEYYDLTTEGERKIGRWEDGKIGKEAHHSSFIIHHSFVRPFDLLRAPLFRVGLLHTPPSGHPSQEGNPGDKYILMVDMHHIISDAISNQVLARDFMKLYAYEAEDAENERESLAPLRLQYKDYSEWLRREAAKGAIKQQEAYWLKEFRGRLPLLNLPTDYERPVVKGMEGERIVFDVGEEETKKMKALALEESATLYMVVLAIYTIFLSKLDSQEDIIVGTPTAGRRHNDLQQIIGMFVATLALRNYPAAVKTFTAFLREAKQRTLEAFENQDYPFEDLLEKITVTKDPGRNPLFDVFFQLNSFNVEPVDQPGVEMPTLTEQQYRYRNKTSKFDLYLYGEERGGSLRFFLEYSTHLFKRETIKMFIKNFKEIISQVVENTDTRLEDIAISHDLYDKKIDIPETGFAF
jgi:hypothetical protein